MIVAKTAPAVPGGANGENPEPKPEAIITWNRFFRFICYLKIKTRKGIKKSICIKADKNTVYSSSFVKSRTSLSFPPLSTYNFLKGFACALSNSIRF